MVGSGAAADMAARVYEWPWSRLLPVPPGDVGGELAEPGARGVVDRSDRQRLPGLGDEPFDVQLDLIERAGAREHRPEVGDVVGRKVGTAEARHQFPVGGIRSCVRERDERRGFALAQVVTDRLARDLRVAERAEHIVAELERVPEWQADRGEGRPERSEATGQRGAEMERSLDRVLARLVDRD